MFIIDDKRDSIPNMVYNDLMAYIGERFALTMKMKDYLGVAFSDFEKSFLLYFSIQEFKFTAQEQEDGEEDSSDNLSGFMDKDTITALIEDFNQELDVSPVDVNRQSELDITSVVTEFTAKIAEKFQSQHGSLQQQVKHYQDHICMVDNKCLALSSELLISKKQNEDLNAELLAKQVQYDSLHEKYLQLTAKFEVLSKCFGNL